MTPGDQLCYSYGPGCVLKKRPYIPLRYQEARAFMKQRATTNLTLRSKRMLDEGDIGLSGVVQEGESFII